MRLINDLNLTEERDIRSDKRKSILLYIILVSVVFVAAYYVSARYYQMMLIQGDSMIPAYHDMQFVLIDKRCEQFDRGDVVALDCKDLSSVLVKRIAAIPGDRVSINEGVLYVNGNMSEIYPGVYFEYAGILEQELNLSADEYIVIGDNVSRSVDSRDPNVGIIGTNNIIGRIIRWQNR